MTCYKCKHEFCWSCLLPYNGGNCACIKPQLFLQNENRHYLRVDNCFTRICWKIIKALIIALAYFVMVFISFPIAYILLSGIFNPISLIVGMELFEHRSTITIIILLIFLIPILYLLLVPVGFIYAILGLVFWDYRTIKIMQVDVTMDIIITITVFFVDLITYPFWVIYYSLTYTPMFCY